MARWGKCSKTGKRRFRSEVEAEAIMVRRMYRARILHVHECRECRVYRCPFCAGWHLTSQVKR